jgi:hypothetical protein
MTRSDDFPGWNNEWAFAEGWGIFELCPARYPDRRYELQYLQNDDFGYPADMYSIDEEAWAVVKQRASYGSAYHLHALAWLKEHSPGEYAFIMGTARVRCA